jgi:glycosyltransferase involved in cell wall biosynthesis
MDDIHCFEQYYTKRGDMRIGIDARNLSNPRPGGFRTYTLGLVSALGSVDQGNRYEIYYDRLPTALPVDLPANMNPNVVSAPFRPIQEQLLLPRRMTRDSVDVALFTGNLLPVMLPDCATVVTIHDAFQMRPTITTLRESRGMRQAVVNLYFSLLAAQSARRATLILTVSNHARQDIAKSLNIPVEKIYVTYNGINRQVFGSLDPIEVRTQLNNQFHLQPGFVLTIGSSDLRKNVQGVLKGYALLPEDLRSKHNLVVVLSTPVLKPKLTSLAQDLGVYDHVTFLENLNPKSLALLYNAACLYITPSFHESCPLTPLEAMECGAPVITSNVSSLPEIVGEAAIKVNPHSAEEIRGAICSVLTQTELREDLRAKSKRHAKKFSWEETARQTIEVLHRADAMYTKGEVH